MSNFRTNFFSAVQQFEQEKLYWFDEGPVITKKFVGINSSSIKTSDIDAFRQGVEITQDKHTLGTYKIYAGTPGHIIKPVSYGVNNLDIISTDKFVEIDYFNPIRYLQAQEPGSKITEVITFPIITSDTNQIENFILNGIIEPLSIRPVASFYSIEFPFESHAVRGSFMGGNSDVRFASSDQVLTVNDRLDLINENYYLDAFESISISTGDGEGSVPKTTFAYVTEKFDHVSPFSDTKVYLQALGITEATHGADMLKVFTEMTGTNGNYVPPGKKSSTSGFAYDNISGTDSIAFGGMTY